jgi:hypothetical protein
LIEFERLPGATMLRFSVPAAFAAATVFFVGNAWAADAPILTKAPPVAAVPVTCGSAYDFFFTSCPLTWYGVTFYGTIDVGGGYQTHGAPFNPDIQSGASYLIQKMNRVAMWGLAPNALSQSNIGVKGNEPFAPGWSFVFQLEAGFDPYSLRLANSPGSMASNIGVPLPSQSTNADSSRAGQFYNSVGYLGVRSDTLRHADGLPPEFAHARRRSCLRSDGWVLRILADWLQRHDVRWRRYGRLPLQHRIEVSRQCRTGPRRSALAIRRLSVEQWVERRRPNSARRRRQEFGSRYSFARRHLQPRQRRGAAQSHEWGYKRRRHADAPFPGQVLTATISNIKA